MRIRNLVLSIGAAWVLASCGTKKVVVGNTGTPATPQTQQSDNVEARKLAFVQKVSDQKVYAQNIVADMSFTATMGSRKVTVPGAVRMRRDEVIRLQLFIPILGSEVGRLEFTPDYVLVIDRMHKQYVKGDYNQLDFLRENGLNFYSLQALFWNQLLLPGAVKVGEADLRKFDVKLDETGQNLPVRLKSGNISYTWMADRESGRIGKTEVNYQSVAHGKSDLVWTYADFKPLGAKAFPAAQEFSFTTTATGKLQKTTVRLEMSDLKTSDDWETRSSVSDRYKQMDIKDIFSQLFNM